MKKSDSYWESCQRPNEPTRNPAVLDFPARVSEAPLMTTRLPLIAIAIWLVSSVATHGQSSATTSTSTPRVAGRAATDADPDATTRRILAEVDAHSELIDNLEYLCDRIGPRMTGSEKLNRASAWARDKFRAYGLEHARLEPWRIAHAWERGRASGRLVAPAEHRLLLESAGWSCATNGPVRGPVVLAEGDDPADVAAYRGRLRGAWVLLDPYTPILPATRLEKLSPHEKEDEPDFTDAPNYPAFRKAFDSLMIEEGAAGLLINSSKRHALIPMYCGGDFLSADPVADFMPTPLPCAFLAGESYGLIWRLRNHGPVEVELDLPNTFSAGPVEVYNTVAELVGVERPEEVVILGAHLDSWDLATGATDNGTGCMAVLEAARALHAVDVHPRRTIRFVLFAGEEQGRVGSKHYVRAHSAELDRISAVLIHDMGTGRVKTIALQDRYDLRSTMDRVVAPFQEALGLDELTHRVTGGTDHVSFRELGIPAFAARQDLGEYVLTHHTQIDTFDKVYADEINQGAKVLAAWAYNVAMLPGRLPRAPGPIKGDEIVSAPPDRPAEGPAVTPPGSQ